MLQEQTQAKRQRFPTIDFSILIVDDTLENRFSIQAAIHSPNYLIETASSAGEALLLIRENVFNLILIDIHLPDMDGFALAEIILSETTEKVPDIIFITADSQSPSIIKRGLTIGASDFLFKPFDIDILRLKIKNQHAKAKRINQVTKSHELLRGVSKELTLETKSHIRSVEYAKLIQERILPKIDDLESKFSNAFVLYQPKEIIGGDFYMMLETNSRIIMVCADCTGHGLPGAMLSMVGYGFLKGIILEKRLFDPGEILTCLNTKIRQFFGKDTYVGSHGMDVSICSYRTDINSLEYASAKRPIYIRHATELHELKGDMVSIGDEIGENHNFKTHTYPIGSDFWLYMFTDGVTDQFGGERNKKFGRKQLKALISETNYHSTANQKSTIENKLREWKTDVPQTDDITLMGKYFY